METDSTSCDDDGASDDWPTAVVDNGLIHKFRRTLTLFRYHRPAQFVRRAIRLAAEKMPWLSANRDANFPNAIPRFRRDPALEKIARRKIASRRPAEVAEVAARFQTGRFSFLNQEIELAPLAGRLPIHRDLPHLWRFHFHYHEFLLDVAAHQLSSGEPTSIADVWEFILSWIEGNPRSDPLAHHDAWHPFCISRRLPVWIALWNIAPPSDEMRERLLKSLHDQARYLHRHLEWDPGGNHLMENLRALAIAALFLQCPESKQWLRRLRRTLPGQLHRQILAHGEHFERSPMYHALMLEAVIDMRDGLVQSAPELSERCGHVAVRMANFLEQLLSPDGKIPLLGDSVLHGAAPAALLLDAAERSSHLKPDSEQRADVVGPYWIWRELGGHQLLFDAGPVGADHLPAHAHCDLLGIEVSVAGRRVIVDSGVFNYEDDLARQYCRSTAAHNTLQIDDRNQCDVWSRFRMGYRGHPSKLRSGKRDGFTWSQASHNAYRQIGVSRTMRTIACRPGGPWIVVDQAVGSRTHRLANHLHLHPDIEWTLEDDSRVTLVCGGNIISLIALGEGRLSVKRSWYCPDFGQRIIAPVVVWEATTLLPAVCGWYFSWRSNYERPQVVIDRDGGISLSGLEEDQAWRCESPW